MYILQIVIINNVNNDLTIFQPIN